MYTEVSDNYKTTINGYSRRFTARLKRDGEIIDAEIKTYSLGKHSSTGEDFCIGCAFSSSTTISCVTDVLLKDQEIALETGLYIGTEVEYVPDGVYTITSAKKKDLVTELTGYDRMYTAGQNAFKVPELPVTLSVATVAVAEQLGCSFDASCLAGVEDITLETMPAGTLSGVAGYLAGLIGRNAYIDRSGKLTFKGYTDSGYEFDGNRISNIDADSSARKINWLECNTGDTDEDVLQSGSGIGYVRFQNPMMTQAILNNITSGIAGFSYYGAEIPFLLGDNRLDPWDVIHYQYLVASDTMLTDENGYILTDEFGNVFVDLTSNNHQISVCCHEIVWKFDGGLSMDINSCALSESEENTNFRGPMQTQIDQAKQAAAEAKKEVGDLDKRLTQKEIFNRLTNNGDAQGMYYDESTGELYINATYIVSGILSSLGGESWINLENGKFKLTNGFLESIKIKDDIRISSSEDSDGFVAIRLNKRARGFDIIFLPEDGDDGAFAIFKGIASFEAGADFSLGASFGDLVDLANLLYMGRYSDAQKRIYFTNLGEGTYPHNCKLYGGDASSVIGIGMRDDKNARAIWSYDDVNNRIISDSNLQYISAATTLNSDYFSDQAGSIRVFPLLGMVVWHKTFTLGSDLPANTNIQVGTIDTTYAPGQMVYLSAGIGLTPTILFIKSDGIVTVCVTAKRSAGDNLRVSGCYFYK